MNTTHRSNRLGLVFFAVYLVVYSVFVAVAAFRPKAMDARPWAGVNLAIWSGFGLIVLAILLAFVYGWACGLAGGGPSGSSAEDPDGRSR